MSLWRLYSIINKMKNYFSSDFKLGILGGGQLGKMLLYETRKYDIQTYVLDPSDQAPCRIACNHFQQGDLLDYQTVYAFGKQVDVLTIEIEAVNVEALATLEKEGVTVYPSSDTLRKIQDKGTQKKFYATHHIPTADFQVFEGKADLLAHLKAEKWDFPFVWKSRKGGYDGRGVSVVTTADEVAQLPDTPCLIEKKIPFKNELAVIVARNPSGEVKTFPVVEMEFHPVANQVEYVICPARIESAVSTKARAVAQQVATAFEHVGLLAVEMFQTQEDNILVNEVAPRPHNSGHYSIEAAYTSQFEQDLRAILDLPLGNTDSKVGGVMVNLVGAEDYQGPVHYENMDKILSLPGVIPHIYGKAETRPFRKMGHVTIVDKDLNEARRIAEKVKGMVRVVSL